MGVWIAKLFRSLFLLIDKIIYWAVNMVYQLFMMIAETGVFTQDSINKFAGRIYALLGVFMLFKVSFSLITYILNPDQFSDKEKGIGKLLTNFFVVLIGIIAVPYIFRAAFGLQTIILKDNVIGNLIMGMNSSVMDTTSSSNYIEQGGNLMSYTTLSAFIQLNENVVGKDCADDPIVGKVGLDGLPIFDSNGVRAADLNSACTSSAFEAEVDNGGTVKSVLIDAYKNNNVYYYTDTDLVNLRADNEEGNEDWIFNYNFIISSAAGGFLAWILLMFCIDIATRSVKLGFLQLIAPIPIISYIDPKSGKDGMFKKWTKQCTSTFLDLFIRLVAVYFAIFVISELINGGIYKVTSCDSTGACVKQTNIFVIVFIIFGALMFAKQLPQLISDITGVKLNGGFTLNPMKKLGQSPYAAGAVGAIGGALGGMAANAYAAKKNGLGLGKGILSTLGGGIGAGRRGLMAGATSDGKGSVLAGATKGITDSSARRNLRRFGQYDAEGNKIPGYSTMDMAKDKAASMAGVKFSGGTSSMLKSKLNELQQNLANSKRNEQGLTTAFNQRISETGNKMAGLLKTFNGEVGARDAKGNITSYAEKDYRTYASEAAKQEATAAGEDWETMTDSRKDIYIQTAVYNDKIVDQGTFDSFNELYKARNEEDLTGRKIEKEANDLQEDMGKFKDRGKK